MRITEINLSNFRAFAAPAKGVSIPLPNGENLLVYGENGAGKSSLFLALRHFFEASAKATPFDEFQNLFHPKSKGWVRLKFADSDKGKPGAAWVWGAEAEEFVDVSDKDATELRLANICKGFIDYKLLLQTYFLPQVGGNINLFPLLIGALPSDVGDLDAAQWYYSSPGLLGNIVNNVSQQTFFANWIVICDTIRSSRRNANQKKIDVALYEFNNGLRFELQELSDLASTYLEFFGYKIKFRFEFSGLGVQNGVKVPKDNFIGLSVEFFDAPIKEHQDFLNEAKLSALALSIFLAAHRRQPTGNIKILAFDDVLIGLDMSNRLPVLDLLKAHFSDYQIVLTTYDRAWFEIVRNRTSIQGWSAPWKTVEMFVGQAKDFESPVVKTKEVSLLQHANDFFDDQLYKAAAVYARTYFEHLIKDYCSTRGLAVKYHENPKKIKANDFWNSIKGQKVKEIRLVEHLNGRRELINTEEKVFQVPLLGPDLVSQVEEARDLFLNPLSHSEIVTPIPSEIKKGLDAIVALEARLKQA